MQELLKLRYKYDGNINSIFQYIFHVFITLTDLYRID